jgi:hypothetical protein
VGRRSLGSTSAAARHTCTSVISLADTGVCDWAAQAGASAATLRRTWSASLPTSLDRAFRYAARQPRQRPGGGDVVDGSDIWIALAWLVGILIIAYAVAIAIYRRKFS